MNDKSASLQADFDSLNDLIVNCPDFDRLEALLGGFNLFQVLKFEHGEIRHSNVLAWILDPEGSHGLDSIFLKKWLMRVLHESSDETNPLIAPVDIDAWQLTDVELRREWKNIDVLLVLTFADKRRWVVCIENKIRSAQHSNQLRRYRSIVETHFSEANKKLFLFLTKRNELPEDEGYISASYTQVHKALKESLENRSHAIGSEPKVLLENYLRLLEEKFMEESEIARTAQRIYQQHRRALDVIFDQKPDYLRAISDKVRQLLNENADSLGIQMEACNKAYVRFIPKAWDVPGNSHGTAWAGIKRTVVFEVKFSGKRPYLYVISGKAPKAWIEPLWIQSASSPFKRVKRKDQPQWWCMLHTAPQSNIVFDDSELEAPEEVAQSVYEWCVKSHQATNTQEVIKIIADQLPALEAAFSTP